MKFGQRLKEQREVFGDGDVMSHILDYKMLKKRISLAEKALEEEKAVSPEVVSEWMRAFKDEVGKFDAHVEQEAREVAEEVDAVEEEAGGDADASKKNKLCGKSSLKDLYLRAKELEFFVDLNKTAARKILKKFDKNLPGHNVSEWRDEECKQLFSFQDDTHVVELGRRVMAVYSGMRKKAKKTPTTPFADLHKSSNIRNAEMELDYHVSCVSDVLAYMMHHADSSPQASPAQSNVITDAIMADVATPAVA